MTTEDDFQTALDAHPDDGQTRLVFADWLDEHGDPRAEGYRVLGRKRFCPLRIADSEHVAWTVGADDNSNHNRHPVHGRSMVPRDWYAQIHRPTFQVGSWQSGMWWVYFHTRRELEDEVSLAFAALSDERRAELLAAPPFTADLDPPKKKSRRKPQK